MPLSNLFKNCIYYWAFGAVIGYPLCLPSYTPPSETQVMIGFVIFALSELGKQALSIHHNDVAILAFNIVLFCRKFFGSRTTIEYASC